MYCFAFVRIQVDDDKTEWQCDLCTLVNTAASRCEACGSARPHHKHTASAQHQKEKQPQNGGGASSKAGPVSPPRHRDPVSGQFGDVIRVKREQEEAIAVVRMNGENHGSKEEDELPSPPPPALSRPIKAPKSPPRRRRVEDEGREAAAVEGKGEEDKK